MAVCVCVCVRARARVARAHTDAIAWHHAGKVEHSFHIGAPVAVLRSYTCARLCGEYVLAHEQCACAFVPARLCSKFCSLVTSAHLPVLM